MAKTINSLKEHLDYIKKELFNGNGLDGITEMSAEERVEFIKKNVDRLLEDVDDLRPYNHFWSEKLFFQCRRIGKTYRGRTGRGGIPEGFCRIMP